MDETISSKEDENTLNIYRLLRIARDLKVKDIAASLEITPSYVNLIEKGEKTPSLSLLKKYAQVLNVPPEIFLSFKPENEKKERFEKTLLKLLQFICERKSNDPE